MKIPLLFGLVFFCLTCGAQYPQHFVYSDESGLPNNEVYSIIQDQRGFIWIGCDVGLYKFDGIRFLNCTSREQTSKSVTGLTINNRGDLFCYNFTGQIFKVVHDSLERIDHNFNKILSLAVDRKGNLWANHDQGISCFNLIAKTWTNFQNFGVDNKNLPTHYTHSARVYLRESLCFLNTEGIGHLENGVVRTTSIEEFTNQPPGRFKLEVVGKSIFVIAVDGSFIFEENNGVLYRNRHPELKKMLQNKKLTNMKALPDGNLWICTYSGIIKYNPLIKKVEHLYPDYAFSDALIDREKNYWFSTLHAGIFRVPNLDFLVWNSGNDFPLSNKLNRTVGAGDTLFFSLLNGFIGKMSRESDSIIWVESDQVADIQCLYYDEKTQSLLFYVGRDLFQLIGKKKVVVQKDVPALKSLLRVGDNFFWMTSSGTYLHELGKPWLNKKPIINQWSREAIWMEHSDRIAVATNSGLMMLAKGNQIWRLQDILFDKIQILSLSYDTSENELYVLDFEARIYVVESLRGFRELTKLPVEVKANRIKYFDNKIYIAGNKGLYIFDLEKDQLEFINSLKGLASDNVQDLIVDASYIWLATGKGLKRIPRYNHPSATKALIFLSNEKGSLLDMRLNYGETLTLLPEVSSYSSNGMFLYAYKINNSDWITLPGSTEKIEIQNIPSGDFTIELKAIDYLGQDSENRVLIAGKVSTPFWRTLWFYLIILCFLVGIGFLIAWKIVLNIRKRENEKTQLAYAQMTALKAQMNPHFMYNALNSIQALILQKDIKNSNLYLSQFSTLMRLILEHSEKQRISISEEIQLLLLYLSLEKLRFGNEFQYDINLTDDIDQDQVFIPPLLLQPFVENSIKHGLLHKNGEKNIKIDIRRQEGWIQIEVEDDGVGRQRALEIRQRQNRDTTSFATHATGKRVQLLNSFEKQNIHIETIDLLKDKLPLGTRVVIRLLNPY